MSLFQSAIASHVCANVLLHLALLIPASSLSHSQLAVVFLPPIWSCHFYAWKSGFGVFSAVHGLWSADLLLFRQPRESFRLIRSKRNIASYSTDDNKRKEIYLQPYPGPLGARFWWVTKLVVSPRFAGWDTGPGPKSRLLSVNYGTLGTQQWLSHNGLRLVLFFLIIDVMNAYQLCDPYFLGLSGIDSALPHALITHFGRNLAVIISPRLIRLSIFAVQQYSIFSFIWIILSLLSASFAAITQGDEFWGSIDIQPLWGSLSIVFKSGLRGFWGKFWHQLFRNMLADPGRALAKKLNVPARSAAEYGIQLGVAFFLSGILHASTLPPNMPNSSPFRYASFFWLNGICVVIELFVSQALKRLDLNRQAWMKIPLMVVRMVWTCCVLYTTGPLLVDEVTRVSAQLGTAPVFLFPAPQT